ncbi:hypothetical protein [Mesorhizobium sp. KR9-304]|uniref:hypothetical protein n=1 Tax=Mesorhizobium sp. KR9-304 TaxID=3156614 RepID=UPI0032B4C795
MTNPSRPKFGVLLVAALFATAPMAHAGQQSDPLIRQMSPGELQNLNNRERRLDYQQRQQINRELDSRANRPLRLDIPVIKPRCRPQSFGTSSIVRTCR